MTLVTTTHQMINSKNNRKQKYNRNKNIKNICKINENNKISNKNKNKTKM